MSYDPRYLEFPAIPAVYDGVEFRSTLESQWARYFNMREWAWMYEPEGCVLPIPRRDGGSTGYTPDFRLMISDEREMYVEVKGPAPWPEELEKCRVLAECGEIPVVMLWGKPLSKGLCVYPYGHLPDWQKLFVDWRPE